MQSFFGKMDDLHTEKLLSGIESYFGTEEDGEQVLISLESHKKLLSLNPHCMDTVFSEEGDFVANVTTFPTSKELMNLFIDGTITEKELFDRTLPGMNFETLYLMSAFVVPEHRRRGLAQQLIIDVVNKVDPEKTMALFAWPTSKEGEALTLAMENKIGRKIKIRNI